MTAAFASILLMLLTAPFSIQLHGITLTKSTRLTRKVGPGELRMRSELASALSADAGTLARCALFTKKDKKEPLAMAGAASVGQCAPSPFSREREGRQKSLTAWKN